MASPRLRVGTLHVRSRGDVRDPDQFVRAVIDELANRLEPMQVAAQIGRVHVRGADGQRGSATAVAARVAEAVLARTRR
jgi:hypothetical protein